MNNLINVVANVAGTSLLVAIFPLPYGYYNLLRLLIFVSGLFLVYQLNKNNYNNWSIATIILVILFNPLVPVFLSRELWLPIDLVGAFIFFYIGYTMNKKRYD